MQQLVIDTAEIPVPQGKCEGLRLHLTDANGDELGMVLKAKRIPGGSIVLEPATAKGPTITISNLALLVLRAVAVAA